MFCLLFFFLQGKQKGLPLASTGAGFPPAGMSAEGNYSLKKMILAKGIMPDTKSLFFF